jgi:hypothetical protein
VLRVCITILISFIVNAMSLFSTLNRLRYSMSLLETNRGAEAVAFLQRTINRFPDEAECKAFATALYTNLGAQKEADKYWASLSSDERTTYSNLDFVFKNLKWGPRSLSGLKSFLSTSTVASL